jgi:hypothetical protein
MANHSLTSKRCTHYDENPIYVFLFWELCGLRPNVHIHVSVSNLYIPSYRSTYFLQQNRQTNPGNIYKSLTDIWVYKNWTTEHYNSVFEITVSFLEIHKWEPNIYIGFSPALHLQCGLCFYSIINFSSIHLLGFLILKLFQNYTVKIVNGICWKRPTFFVVLFGSSL